MNWAAYLSYVVVSCITPGPNTMFSMSCAAQSGFRKTLRFIVGVWLGFMLVSLLAGGFTALLYDLIPRLELPLLVLGAAYILYLAWRVWRSEPGGGTSAGGSRGVLSGLAMQFVNVKGVIFAITAMSSYILPHGGGAWPVLLAALVMSTCAGLSCCAWALFGAALEGLYRRHTKAINAVMALALVWCAASLFL